MQRYKPNSGETIRGDRSPRNPEVFLDFCLWTGYNKITCVQMMKKAETGEKGGAASGTNS